MTTALPDDDSFIWATRGASWGFRFLKTAGLDDPLVTYDRAFGSLGESSEVCHCDDGVVALRFSDPDGRLDRAGRLIPHEFVLFGSLASRAVTVNAGRDAVWPLVKTEYSNLFEAEHPSG